MTTLLQLTGFLKAYRWRVLAAILLGAGTVLAGVGLLASSGYLISAAALQPPILDLMVIIVSVRFFGISRAVLRYSERLLSHDITFRLLMNMRSWFFGKLVRQPAQKLTGYQSAELLSSITSDVDELQNFYVRVVAPVVVAMAVIGATTFFLYHFNPWAALAAFLLLTLNGAGVPLLTRRLAKGYGKKQVELRGKLYHRIVEGVQGIEESRLFGLQQSQLEERQKLHEQLAELDRKQSRITGLQDTLANGMQYAAVFVALLVTVPLVINGDLSGVMVAMILLAVMGSFEATQNLGTAFQYLESTEKAADKLLDLINPKQSAEAPAEKGDQTPIEGDIEYSGVTFGYYDQRTILRDFSMVIPEGSHTAVVGPTGSGKSTLLNLVMKFYQPASGAIRIGGRELTGIPEEALRQAISVVDQQTYLFTDTLRNNLTIAQPGATDDELRDALKMAEMEKFVQNLPHGLDTPIGEHGKSMSGGERQRLALARAILKNTSIWALDEPTANLDTLTEQALLKTIRRLTRGKTVLWITHRLVDMDQFDNIIVLKEGKPIQSGTHQELISQKGWYRDMLGLQLDYLEAGSG